MLGYGFAISDNPFDHYAVGFRVPPGSPLEETRRWRAAQSSKANKKSKTDDDYRYYIFNVDHPRATAALWLETSVFSHDLFDSISVLCANFRELQSDRFGSTGIVIDMNPEASSDAWQYRNLFHTLCQLRLECSARSKLLKANTPRSRDGSTLAMSLKQQYAKLYKDSQLEILETAALLCRYCLLRAENPHQEDIVLIFSAAAAEQISQVSEATANLQKLLHRTPSAIKSRTLFSFSAAVEMLPVKLASKIRDTADTLSGAVGGNARLSFPQSFTMFNEIQEKIRLTVLLAGLRKAYSERSTMLPDNLKLWMGDLQAWYPFDDPSWNGPTEDFLPTLKILVEATDRILLDTSGTVTTDVCCDPQVLCWCYNVTSEEGLFSDTEVLESNGRGAVCQPSRYLLCIP